MNHLFTKPLLPRHDCRARCPAKADHFYELEEDKAVVSEELSRATEILTEIKHYYACNIISFHAAPRSFNPTPEIVLHILPELSRIVSDYNSHDVLYKLGMNVKVSPCSSGSWFVGEIKELISIGCVRFAHLNYLGFDACYDEWIPCGSPRLKCFYNDNNTQCIEKLPLIAFDKLLHLGTEDRLKKWMPYQDGWEEMSGMAIQYQRPDLKTMHFVNIECTIK